MSNTKPPKSRQPGRMAAAPNAPWIGVHVLSEFVFCHRAGLVAYYNSQEDTDPGEDEENRDQNSDYVDRLPDYDFRAIEARLNTEMDLMWRKWPFLLYSVCALVILGFIVLLYPIDLGDNILLFVLGCVFVSAYGAGIYFLSNFRSIRTLKRRHWLASTAVPRQPGKDFQGDQHVDWWELHKAGFQPTTYKESLRDVNWRLAGRPWRVLRKGSLVIPVFKKNYRISHDSKLYWQHRARIAAYCHLITQCEGAESPYGIVLYRGTYKGVAVANTPSSRAPFHNGLVTARSVILDAAAKRSVPDQPENVRKCWGCPHGKPFVREPGEPLATYNGVRLPVYSSKGVDGHIYHSACGDHFRWVPPHEKAEYKELF